jgi:hypothetical protein
MSNHSVWRVVNKFSRSLSLEADRLFSRLMGEDSLSGWLRAIMLHLLRQNPAHSSLAKFVDTTSTVSAR